jgi:hypothetical protein
LLQDAVLRAKGEIIARLARNSDATGLVWVLELTVTSAGYCETPTILLQQPEDFAYFHVREDTRACSVADRCHLGDQSTGLCSDAQRLT